MYNDLKLVVWESALSKASLALLSLNDHFKNN